MNRYQQIRFERLMPNGIPRYLRIYDNEGKSMDRYTVVFTHNFPNRNRKCLVRAMSKNPKSPQGFGMLEEYNEIIDFPSYSHLGKRITFKQLPDDCKDIVISDYVNIWNLIEEEEEEENDNGII